MEPLVSVLVATYNRPELLTQRCLPSILAQTHRNLDIHVVGDGCTEETLNKMGDLPSVFKDERIRFTNRPRPTYPPGELDAWHISGSYAWNYGLDTVLGDYVCAIADDDEYLPTYVEKLVAGMAKQDVDLIYCASEVIAPDGLRGYLGVTFPPRICGQSGGEFMWRRNATRLDPECWRRGMPNDWDFIDRMIRSGMRVGHVKEALYKYHPSRHVPGCGATLPENWGLASP